MTPSRSEPSRPEVAAWNEFVDALRNAGERLAADTADLDASERADGLRALVRAVLNQLGRFEIDRDRPELVAFNGWRQKFLMDNPDFRYWVADIRGDRRYRIVGNRGDAGYMSITVYTGTGTSAQAATRIDTDSMTFDETGGFDIAVRGAASSAPGDWLELPEDASALWVRYFHNDVAVDRLGWCTIAPVEAPPAPPPIDPPRFSHQLRRLATTTAALPQLFAAASAEDLRRPNQIRHWSEMTGGAAFTEPDIHYLRGAWQLAPDETLLIEGELAPCRYWNVLAYSRYLNSLDYRHRRVSYTGGTATIIDGHYRFALAAEDPGLATADWVDTEGRPFGIVVMRFLQPEQPPKLPSVQRLRLDELTNHR